MSEVELESQQNAGADEEKGGDKCTKAGCTQAPCMPCMHGKNCFYTPCGGMACDEHNENIKLFIGSGEHQFVDVCDNCKPALKSGQNKLCCILLLVMFLVIFIPVFIFVLLPLITGKK